MASWKTSIIGFSSRALMISATMGKPTFGERPATWMSPSAEPLPTDFALSRAWSTVNVTSSIVAPVLQLLDEGTVKRQAEVGVGRRGEESEQSKNDDAHVVGRQHGNASVHVRALN